jgi:steroid delta-isomerase-like uncharacterized protein
MDPASVANEFIDAFNNSNWERFSALCSPDMIYEERGTNRSAKGRDGVLEVGKGWKAAMSDIQGMVFDSVGCGTTAVLEIRWTGTHDGPLEMANGTLAATGRTIEIDAAQIYTVENGLITSMRNYADFLTMAGQLGLIPS